MKRHIVSILVVTGICFTSVEAFSHRIDPIYPCDGMIDVRKIPCLMKKKGWKYAAGFMETWFGEINHGENYVLDIRVPRELSEELSIFSTTVNQAIREMKTLDFLNKVEGNILYELNRDAEDNDYHDKIQRGESFDFDFIALEKKQIFSTKKHNWASGGEEQITMHWTGEKVIGNYPDTYMINEFTAAFGRAAMRLIVRGNVEFIEDDKAKITIDSGATYFRDSYDFGPSPIDSYNSGPSPIDIVQPLGCWTTKQPFILYPNPENICVPIFNIDFRVWDPKRNHDYRIFSVPEEFEYKEKRVFYVERKDGVLISSSLQKNCTDDNTCTGNQTTDDNSGKSTSPDPTETPASGKLPDFITSKVTMGNKDGNHEKYTWKINETAYVHDYIDNIGTADWEGSADKIKVPFYLSKGSKEDSHSEWVRIGDRQSIKKENLKVKKDPKHEKIEFKLQDYANDGTIMPGRTYNFVVCADRPKDEDNGDGDVKEKHKSNNCSTEAVFYVDYGPPRNVDLLARNLALTGGKTSLQAGEQYGLQVELSNIGTEQPWNGFSSNYEIKGPGTGGVWQRIGEDTSRASSLYPNATHFESMSSEQEVAAPMVGGDYVFRACADYTQAVPETDESNNCTAELPVYIAPPPMPDLITEGLQLTHGRTSLIAGELYGLTVAIRNVGDAKPSSDIRTNYEIKGPGTGDAWQFVADDSTDADNLAPGASQWEEITDGHGAHIPEVPGTYTARACADYQGRAQESNESNNCSEITFEVQPVPAGSPRIVITNPNSDDDWRSDATDHDFRWNYYDFPEAGHVRIEYSLDGGATWLLVTDSTDNDGRKYWEDMCDYHTVDTHHAFVRITSVEYPYVYDISDEFLIDHAAECE